MPDPFDIPSTGPISLQTIQQEYGGPSSPIPINSYYAGGAYVPAGTTGNLGPIPTAGTVSFDHYRGSASGPPPSGVVGITNTHNFNGSQPGTSINQNINIGTADPNRSVVVIVAGGLDGFPLSNLSVSINGQPGQLGVVEYTTTGDFPTRSCHHFAGIYASASKVPTGTTCNLTASWTQPASYIVSVYSIITAGGAIRPFASDKSLSQAQTITLNAQAPKDAFIAAFNCNSVIGSNYPDYTTSGMNRTYSYRDSRVAPMITGMYTNPTASSGTFQSTARNSSSATNISMSVMATFEEF